MESLYSVKLGKLIQEFRLEVLRGGAGYEDVSIRTEDVNRPGLQLTGFFDYFDAKRLQVIGRVETTYLEGLTSEERRESFELLLSQDIPALIISREIEPFPECMEMAEKYDRTILRSPDTTSVLMSNIIAALKSYLAPRITRHGVLIEVYGEGILLVGDSGVGKSETAIELIKRGHRLIADDAVEIRRVSSKSLVGRAPENIRHFIELRGVGIINARRIFGMGAIKMSEKIDMCINMEIWDATKLYDRMGIDSEYTEILGIRVPVMTIPVKPGRNLAVIIEVAAMNNRQKKMGYNAAQELLSSLGVDLSELQGEDIKKDLDI